MTRRFIFKLIAFGLPFVVIAIVSVGFTIYVGEGMPLQMVVDLQLNNTPVLFHPKSGTTILAYKLAAMKERKPEVIVFGSSRVYQFRSMLFNRDSDVFYNAGAPGWTLNELERLADGWDDNHAPDALILSLDTYWFNPDYIASEIATDNLYVHDKWFDRILDSTADVIKKLMSPNSSFSRLQLFRRQDPMYKVLALGLQAIQYGTGYRNDGSMQLGHMWLSDFVWLKERERFELMLDTQTRFFLPGDQVSTEKLALLERILQLAQDNNVTVVGFFAPYAPGFYDEMMASNDYTYFPKAVEQVGSLFDRFDFSFIDFSDAAAFRWRDDMMIDGLHPSEYVVGEMYLKLFEQQPAVLGAYTDYDQLAQTLEQASNRFQIFKNEF